MVAENKNVASVPNATASPTGRNLRPRSKSKSSTGMTTTASDGFYDKLCKVNESNGLSLVFNFRESSLDLQQFYKNVTERGGYHQSKEFEVRDKFVNLHPVNMVSECGVHPMFLIGFQEHIWNKYESDQVTRDGSWEEVASAVNLKSKVPMSPAQLQKLYSSILYQYEQTYHYRTPGKHAEDPTRQDAPKGKSSGIEDLSTCSPGKRKHCHLSDLYYSSSDSPSKKTKYDNNSGQISTVPSTEEPKLTVQLPVKEKEIKRDPYTPLGPRTGYQIFIKIECDRLKRIHRDSSSGQIRDMAIEAWKKLSEDDKKPYVNASKKDKERYIREMAAYHQHKIHAKVEYMSRSKTPNFLDFAMATEMSEKDEDYQFMLTELNRKNNCKYNTSTSTNPKLLDFAISSEKDEDYHYVMSELEAAENKCQNISSSTTATQKVIDFGKPLQIDNDYYEKCQITEGKVMDIAKRDEGTDGDYHVRLEPDVDQTITYVSDESVLELAIGMMKNARPSDPIFQMNWDDQ